SFSSMFAGFKDLNAFTTFYKIPDVSSGVVPIGVGKDAARTIISSFVTADTVSTPQMTLAGNSAAYFEFRSPDNGRGNLTVTVETLDGVSDASYNLIVKGRSITIPARRSSSAKFVTFELTDFGGKYDTAVLTAGDTALLAKNEVSFRAVAYYEPS
ncbi:MAG: hypothetical protein IK093_07185, partial [Ruminiclostridium sp.]|nr:hypothetical protein [Ruminiclostridium sp.]